MLLLGIVIGFALSGLVLLVPVVLAQGLPPLQEFVPLPGPARPQPDQGPGLQQGQDDCQTILFYFNGQLYRLMPGPGPQDGPGRPGSPPEFFRLDPYRGLVLRGPILILGMGEELWMRFVPKYLELLGAGAWGIAVYGTLKDLLDAVYQYPGGWLADRLGGPGGPSGSAYSPS